jgi:large subunit GTPase 1
MVLAKSKKAVGLGNSLMNDRFGKGKGMDMRRGNFQEGIQRTGATGETVCAFTTVLRMLLTKIH